LLEKVAVSGSNVFFVQKTSLHFQHPHLRPEEEKTQIKRSGRTSKFEALLQQAACTGLTHEEREREREKERERERKTERERERERRSSKDCSHYTSNSEKNARYFLTNCSIFNLD
jgi:hypothetical protein